jgi:hypothetical protein
LPFIAVLAALVASLFVPAAALAAPPANDLFATAEVLPAGGGPFVAADNTDATTEAGEPPQAGGTGGHTVWYRWDPETGGDAVITACGPSSDKPDLVLDVYTGTTLETLARIDSVGGDATCGSHTIRVDPTMTYHVRLASYSAADTGAFTGSLTFSAGPANDDFADYVTLTGDHPSAAVDNRHATRQAGEPVNYQQTDRTVWFRWTPAVDGFATFSSCDASFDDDLGVFTGSSLDALTTVTTADVGCSGGLGRASTTIAVTAGTEYVIQLASYFAGDGGAATLKVDLERIPANDDFAMATLLTGHTVAHPDDNRLATPEPADPRIDGYDGPTSVWYRWTAPGSGWVTISNCDAAFDSLLGLYTGGDGVDELTAIAEADGGCGGAGASSLMVQVVGGTRYSIYVGGWNGEAGDYTLNISTTPFVTTPPSVSGAAVVGGTLTLDPGEWGGTGTLTQTIQWYRCDADDVDCTAVGDGTGSYDLSAADLGARMMAEVATSGDNGTTRATSEPLGPVEPDADGDGDGEPGDNCPGLANPAQIDTDADGQGDACDLDDDGDGVSDAAEISAGTDPRKADTDGDGRDDKADSCPTVEAATADGCPAKSQEPKVEGPVKEQPVVEQPTPRPPALVQSAGTPRPATADRRGAFTVPGLALACPAAAGPCRAAASGTLSIAKKKKKKATKSAKAKAKKLKLSPVVIDVAAGGSAAVRMKLSRSALKALKAAKQGTISVTVTLANPAGTSAPVTVAFTLKAPKKG